MQSNTSLPRYSVVTKTDGPQGVRTSSKAQLILWAKRKSTNVKAVCLSCLLLIGLIILVSVLGVVVSLAIQKYRETIHIHTDHRTFLKITEMVDGVITESLLEVDTY